MRTLLVSAALALALAPAAACSKSSSDAPAKTATAPSAGKDPAAAKALIAQGAVVLDVRTPDEFSGDHLAQATNVPIDDFAARLAEVDQLVGGDKGRPVVVYCGKGGRAAKAKQQLEAAGYTQVVNGGGLGDLR